MAPWTEQQLLDNIIDLAGRTGWAIHHDRPARRAGTGWATHIAGHAGFPDLVVARRGIVLFRELKGYQANGRLGRLSSEQRDWGKQLQPDWQPYDRATCLPLDPVNILALRRGWLFDVWTPDDWVPLIIPTLTTRTPAGIR